MSSKTNWNSILVILTVLVVIGTIYAYNGGYLKGIGLSPGAIVSISNIQEGTITSDGHVINGRILVQAKPDMNGDTLIIRTKDTPFVIGGKTVQPQKNVKIVLKAKPAYATTDGFTSSVSFFGGALFQDIKNIEIYQNNANWRVYAPYDITIYADDKDIPDTLVYQTTTKTLVGQQELDMSGDGKIRVTQTELNIPQGGDIPAANIIAFQSPDKVFDTRDMSQIKNIDTIMTGNGVYPDGGFGKMYLFNAFAFRDATDRFKTYITGGLSYYRCPYCILWTGQDYSILPVVGGWSQTNPNWKGLPSEVAKPSQSVSFDAFTKLFTYNGVTFTPSFVLSLDTALVDTIVVERNVGSVMNEKIEVTQEVKEGLKYKATVSFTNGGQDDGFNLNPTAKSGLVSFSPVMYGGVNVSAGQVGTFVFEILSTGTITDVKTLSDQICVEITPVHNGAGMKSTCADITVTYTPSTGTGAPQTIGNATTGAGAPVSGKVTILSMWDSIWIYLGIGITVISGISLYTEAKKMKLIK